MALIPSFLQVTGSGVFSLGTGSDTKKTRLNVSLITGPLLMSGSLTVQRRTAASPSSSNSYYTRYLDGQIANGALSASGDVWVESGGSEIFVSSSLSGNFTASLYYSHISDT